MDGNERRRNALDPAEDELDEVGLNDFEPIDELDLPEPENEDPRDEWERSGYGSYRSWWENEGYMTHPEPAPESDEFEDE